MGTISTGIGLISGINTAQLIEGLLAIEARGKTTLQSRVSTLQTQRTALLDINARLLNLKNASRTFRLDKVFRSALAISSDEEVLTATASAAAQPGTYQFIVRQLVSTSQQMTRGFADRTTTPLGLPSMSFEFGRGQLAADTSLDQLNGGQGIDRGRIVITDRSGAQATIDLTDVVTINEVIERINEATGVSVTASVSGDRLVIADDSGGAGSLIVTNATGDTTATDLGIAGSIAGATLTGNVVNTLGADTALTLLNDGNGVLVRNNVPDLAITARDGTAIDVDFGRIDAPLTNATLLSDLNNGAGVTISDDDENPDIKFVARDGTEHEVNLNGITTIGGLISRVATETSGHITLSISADGQRLTVTDTVGGAENLRVLGAGDNQTQTAEDLGILNVAGVAADTFDGSIIPSTIDDPPASTIQDIIDRINDAEGNEGRIVASIAADGMSLLITDTTAGAGNLIIQSTAGNPHAARALGIETDVAGVAASTVDGTRLLAGLGSVLVNNLNGGDGLNGATTITLTDRSGASVTLSNLNTFDSLQDIIAAINTQAASGNVDISVGFNAAGNGLAVTDSSGGVGSLIVTGDGAEALGIDTDVAGVAANSVRGSNLQLRYVSESSRLSDLNYGRGVGVGRFRITDATGATADVDIGTDSTSLYDVITEINSRGLAINARLNDTGDGLIIESDLDVGEIAVTRLKIESLSGTAAKDLNILGTAETIENGVIDGTYERTVEFAESDTLNEAVAKINAAGIPVNASVINSGSGVNPFRINFTSKISGRLGELIIDSGDIDLGLTSLARGRDARVIFGGTSSDDGFLVTSASNSVTNVIDGVTINLLETSDDPVTLTVERDTPTIISKVKAFVTAFNDAIGRIDDYDSYNVETEQRGPLLGNPTTSRVRDVLFRAVQQRARGVDTQFQYLRQVGITIGSGGALTFDEEQFTEAYENDPTAVENLFAAFESSNATSEEILPGVTVQRSEQNVTTSGFGDIFDALLDDLTNSIDGTVKLADNSFQTQIELLNDRIEEFDKRLEAKRARLESQFAVMEAALARLQGQNNSLSSLAANVALAQGLIG
jgi:flagellar hook-associated protein 2